MQQQRLSWGRCGFVVCKMGSYLHTVIVLISHYDSSLAVTCHPCWTIKLTGPGTQGTELVVESTTRLEYLRRDEKSYDISLTRL